MKNRAIASIVLVIMTALSGVFLVPPAQATPLTPDWFTGEPFVKEADREYSTKGCVNEMRQIKTNKISYYKEEDYHAKSWCVYHYKNYDIAFYKRWFSSVLIDSIDVFNLYAREESGMAIAFDDGPMTPVDNIDYSMETKIRYGQDMEKPVAVGYCQWVGCAVMTYDFAAHIPQVNNATTGFYTYDSGQDGEQLLKYSDGEVMFVAGLNVSNNGKWSSFAIPNVGLVRLNNQTGVWQIIDVNNYSIPSWAGSYTPATTISNDGRLVSLISGIGDDRIVQYTEGCGIWLPSRLAEDGRFRENLVTTCRYVSIEAALTPALIRPNGNYSITNYSRMSSNNESIIFQISYMKWYVLYPANSLVDGKIAYLALGDSFSSGEGDIVKDGVSHYLPGTNVLGDHVAGIPRELCHISDRSYPFLLAADMGITRGNDMQSIACSGAVRNDIYQNSSDISYDGQPILQFDGSSTPRLSGLTNVTDLQNDALAQFIPGRIRQIEMVKEYKPKVVTIGVSGNDLGFSNILYQCMTNPPLATCDSAQGEGLAKLGSAIQGNYQSQLDLYKALKQASPGTDFYAVGYPQFISDSKAFCWEIGNSLNQQERTMIRNAVSFTNQTIKSAAAAAGIKYIDVENAITSYSGDMCAESGLITDPVEKVTSATWTEVVNRYEDGYADSNPVPIKTGIIQNLKNINRNFNEGVYINALALVTQETFHPNALGHKAMYDYVHKNQLGGSLLDAVCDGVAILCPESLDKTKPAIPSYFGVTDTSTSFRNFVSVNDGTGRYVVQTGLTVLRAGDTFSLNTGGTGILPGWIVDIVLRSEPREIGAIAADNAGNVAGLAVLPEDTPVGYHTLSVTGTSASGNKVEYAQTIFVIGPSGDIDGDGVVDANDSCQFIVPSGIDSDNDAIDDACDLDSKLRPGDYKRENSSEEDGGIDTQPSTRLIVDNRLSGSSGYSSTNMTPIPNLIANTGKIVAGAGEDKGGEIIWFIATALAVSLLIGAYIMAKSRLR